MTAKKDVKDVAKIEKPGALEIPDWIVPSRIGAEHITKDDIRIPRLLVAQKGSPQVDQEHPDYMPDLRPGDVFNDLTKEIYGDGPVKVVIVRGDPPRWVEFDEEMNVKDPFVVAGDPRTLFTTDSKGARMAPIATCFYDYVVLLVREDGQLEPMAFSFKSTGIGDAKRLNSLILMKKIPIFACVYEFTPNIRTSGKNSWYGFSVDQAGFVDKETYLKAEAQYANFKNKDIKHEDAEKAAVSDM